MAKKNTYPRTIAMITEFKRELIAEMKKNLEKNTASGALRDSIQGTKTEISNDN